MDTSSIIPVDPVLVLEDRYLQVEPGAELRTRLSVRSGGAGRGPDAAVERYRLEVLGEAARWAQVEPRQVAVPADGTGQVVEVVFRPPHAAATPALRTAFGVRAYAVDDRDRAAVVEGELLLTAVPDLTASIEPVAASGRWGAGYRLRFDHAGRVPLALRVVAADAPRALRFAVAPAQVTVAPGHGAQVLVSVRPRAPKLLGAPVRHAFAVDHRADTGSSAGRSTAVFEQRAVLPTAVAAALAVLVAALLVGVALVVSGARAPAPAATAASAAPGPPTGAEQGAPDPVQGFLVLYGPPTPVDDPAGRGRRGPLPRAAARRGRGRPHRRQPRLRPARRRPPGAVRGPARRVPGPPRGPGRVRAAPGRGAPVRRRRAPVVAGAYGLGVDLGTTYTAAAAWRDGRAEAVPLGQRAHTVPSVLFLRDDDVLQVGEAAVRRGALHPDRVAREFKRSLGDGIPLPARRRRAQRRGADRAAAAVGRRRGDHPGGRAARRTSR